jgi:hypothetical protein
MVAFQEQLADTVQAKDAAVEKLRGEVTGE